MAEDIRLAKGEEVDAIKAELAKKVYTSTLANDGYLKVSTKHTKRTKCKTS